jgi:hypothetical protein
MQVTKELSSFYSLLASKTSSIVSLVRTDISHRSTVQLWAFGVGVISTVVYKAPPQLMCYHIPPKPNIGENRTWHTFNG